jgi:hypothetical protein
MTWIRVDDHFADHPKVMALAHDRLTGLGLWHVAASYCARYLTNGFVPSTHVRANAPVRLINRMVAVGLFDPVDGGYMLHDWLNYNPSREAVKEAQAKKRAAGQAGGRASAGARAQANGAADDEAKSNPVPVPQPIPVSEVLLSVPSARDEWVDPMAFYQERAHRKSLSQKERDWIEDLHARFSRKELVGALQVVPPGTDYLKRVDAFLEGKAA